MAKSFDELVARTTTQRVRERGKAQARKYLGEMLLAETRRLRGLSQKELAAALHIKQPSLSKLEGQSDMQVSTLQRIVEALGGRLVITAQFPEGGTTLSQFDQKSKRVRKVREVKLVA
jgi:transcriptional regulator with XRE-family HTH domain